MNNFNINLLPRKLLGDVNAGYGVEKKNNVTYIHFYNDEQKDFYFNFHFLIFDETVYYADYFTNENITDKIMNLSSNVNKNFNYIIENNLYTNINIDKALIIFVHTKSPGHELAFLTNAIYIYHYYNLHDFKIVISDKIFELGKQLISILYLFFDKSNIIIVNNFTKININETYNFFRYSSKMNEPINFLLNKLSMVTIEPSLCLNYENICLIKTEFKNKTFNSSNRSFSNNYNLFFKNNGFDIIIVEDLEIIELYYLIKKSKNIVLSWGANSWCNSTFVNTSHNLITLCHIGYKTEYETFKNIENIEKNYSQWTPICNKNILIYDLDTELTKDTEILLEIKLEELKTI